MPPILLSLLFNKWTYIIGAILAAVLYISILRHENATLTSDNAKLTFAVEEQKQAIANLQKEHAAIVKAKDEIQAQIQQLQKDDEDLKKALNKKISLGVLADKKTILVQKAINNGTAKVLKCFEMISEGGKC